jgi:hypothetical protein
MYGPSSARAEVVRNKQQAAIAIVRRMMTSVEWPIPGRYFLSDKRIPQATPSNEATAENVGSDEPSSGTVATGAAIGILSLRKVDLANNCGTIASRSNLTGSASKYLATAHPLTRKECRLCSWTTSRNGSSKK